MLRRSSENNRTHRRGYGGACDAPPGAQPKETGFDIHYIGSAGIERELMENQPLTFHTVQSGKLRRYFDWKNLTDPFRVVWGAIQSIRLIGKIKPDVCFSKGGFVAVPVVIGCWVRRVPVLAHESDLTPGLANRISARFAKKVAATFPECAKALAPITRLGLQPETITVTPRGLLVRFGPKPLS